MSADGSSFFSRGEVLGGLPARRASVVLFGIEARTAHLVAKSKRAMAYYLTERTAQEREQAFLQAIAGGRELPLVPTIQDLERHSGAWAPLVPPDPPLRAAIAESMGKKYVLTADRVPGIRTALGLDTQEVAAAFESQQRRSLPSIYALGMPVPERLRWARSRAASRLENLPPFWMAYALTLTETIGTGLLVLPIVLAGVGPLLGVVILVVLGALNMLTIAALVEGITRSGPMRFGSAYFGKLAGALLGRSGSSSITITLIALNVALFLAYLLAFGLAVGAATGTSALIWAGLLFLVNLFFLRRRDLDSTVATAIVVGAVNVGLIVVISAVAMTHLRPDNLVSVDVPVFGSGTTHPHDFGLIFGVVLMAYFGHTSAGNVAKVVLQRDPTGNALLRGALAATASAIALYSLVVVAIDGAVKPATLTGYGGTAIKPLADEVGSSVSVLGAMYVVLAIGLGSIYISLGMFNQVREWLPPAAEGGSGLSGAITAAASRRAGEFWLCASPALLVFALVEWLIATDRASFAQPLGLVGTLTLPLLGGVFPMLLLAASRRRGDYVPGTVVRLLAGNVSIAAVALIFFAAVLVQGFVIWQQPGERLLAGVAAALIAVVTGVAARRGSFLPRSVIELRREPSGGAVVAVTIGGAPGDALMLVSADGAERAFRGSSDRLDRFESVQFATFDLPPSDARQLKVWVHGVTADGESEPIPASVRLDAEAESHPIRSGDGALLLDLTDPTAHVRVTIDRGGT